MTRRHLVFLCLLGALTWLALIGVILNAYGGDRRHDTWLERREQERVIERAIERAERRHPCD